ncbi:MAG: hypothetical protein SVE93_00275 [Candidatus Thermoplasmatota archaeon]|nr:hypothetical protein [Candidatus Thermoplasmatota archaeon]
MDEGYEYEIPKMKPRIGFILSVIAGMLIILSAVMVLYLGVNPSLLEAEEMQGTLQELAERSGMETSEVMDLMSSMYLGMGIFGVVSGLLILLGGALAYYRGFRVGGGVIVLLFSILSLFGGGGLFLGLILGVIGGVLILMNR